MHDSMLSEKDDLAWSTHEPLPILQRALVLVEGQLLNRTADRNAFPQRSPDKLLFVRTGGDRDRTSFEQCTFEIIDEVSGVLDTDAQANEVFWKTALRARCSVDGGMPNCGYMGGVRSCTRRRR